MVQSASRMVVVGLSASEVTIGVSDSDPVALDWITVSGHLQDLTAGVPIADALVKIYVLGALSTTVTTDWRGNYSFLAQFEEGRTTLQANYDGDPGHAWDASFLTIVEAWRPTTSLSISVSPSRGAPPLIVWISGSVTRDDLGSGINVQVTLFKDGVEIDSQFAGADGRYSFADTIPSSDVVTYYTKFEGNLKFQGCEGVILPCPGCRHPVDSRGKEEVACGFCGAVSEVVPIIG